MTSMHQNHIGFVWALASLTRYDGILRLLEQLFDINTTAWDPKGFLAFHATLAFVQICK